MIFDRGRKGQKRLHRVLKETKLFLGADRKSKEKKKKKRVLHEFNDLQNEEIALFQRPESDHFLSDFI